MTNKPTNKNTSQGTGTDGHQRVTRGHQPLSTPNGTSGVQGGHQPTKGEGTSGAPPNQGSGGKKK